MGAVGIEKSAAVGAQHLDRFLRSNRPLRNRLVGNGIHHRFAIRTNHRLAIGSGLLDLLRFEQFRGVIRPEILHDALRNQQQRIDDAGRQQYPESGAGHVDPEISEVSFSLRAMPRMNATASAIPTAADAKL